MSPSATVRARSFLILFVLLCSSQLAAQPDLNFKRIRLAWPYVEVYFSVGCNGVKNYSLQPGDVRLLEDGRVIDDFGIWCPDPTSRCPITVGLVFDASDSMKGEGNEGAKAGGATFIGNMDNSIDEACVIHFNQTVWTYQQMTTDTVLLKSAVSLLPATGATALWDAIWRALAIVQNNGHNQCRAVIVLSDGDDNSSVSHGLPDIISFAVRYNIRVFPIGYGENIAADDLQQLAALTGGVYYQTPDAKQLSGIYREISTILYDYFQECVVDYDPRCGDEMPHEVELQVNGICGGNASMKRVYTSPRDSMSLKVKEFALTNASGMGGGDIRMPIELRSPFFKELLYPLSIRIAFDRTRLRLVGVETPPGTLLFGMKLDIADLSAGGTIRIPESRVIEGAGTLCYALLRSVLHDNAADYPVHVESAVFDKGCIVPQFSDGVIHVGESMALIGCAVQAPESVAWNSTAHRYDTDPVILHADIANGGTLPAAGGTVMLDYDAAVFELLDPRTPVQTVDTVHAGGQASLQWKLRVKPQGSAVTGDLCLRSVFDAVEETRCCASVSIPAAGMLLHCAAELPTLNYNATAKAFVPNPFDLTFEVANDGVISSGALRVLLQLPEGLYIESGEQYEKILNPSPLAPGSSASLSWRLRLISPLGGDRLPIRFELRNDGVVYRSCEDTLVVPWIPPVFEGTIIADGPITFCQDDSVRLDAGEGYTDYRWSSGEKTRFIVVRKSGLYYASVRDTQGKVGQTKAVLVTVNPRPGKPLITREHNTLVTTASGMLQWYRNGIPIPGATGNTLQAVETGSYTVVALNAFGCSSASEPFLLNVLPVISPPHPSQLSVSLYPHPVTSELRVRITGAGADGSVLLLIHDLLGKKVGQYSVAVNTSEGDYSIDVSALRPGLYLLAAVGHDRIATGRFLRR
ncbi:MAG: VWA domain-containing protein [Bacteroidetes bacterium]|nr:VWA domain-containing protein [Bacteroidota bacterium]